MNTLLDHGPDHVSRIDLVLLLGFELDVLADVHVRGDHRVGGDVEYHHSSDLLQPVVEAEWDSVHFQNDLDYYAELGLGRLVELGHGDGVDLHLEVCDQGFDLFHFLDLGCSRRPFRLQLFAVSLGCERRFR